MSGRGVGRGSYGRGKMRARRLAVTFLWKAGGGSGVPCGTMRPLFPRSMILLLGALTLIPLQAAPPERKARADIAPAPLRAGTVLLEERVLQMNEGEYKVESAKGAQSLAARYHQRVNLRRRVQGAENEDVMVEDHAEDLAVYFANPPAVAEKPGILVRQHLHARKRLGVWMYEPQDRKPENTLNSALVKLSWLTTLMDLLPAGIGSQQRTVGETWKTEFPAPRGKAKGVPVLTDYDCTLEAVEDVRGEPHARISVRGTLKVEQPTFAGSSSATFTATILRRLKDKLDVETTVNGSFAFTGPVTAEGNTPATLKLILPYTIRRTLRIEPR